MNDGKYCCPKRARDFAGLLTRTIKNTSRYVWLGYTLIRAIKRMGDIQQK